METETKIDKKAFIIADSIGFVVFTYSLSILPIMCAMDEIIIILAIFFYIVFSVLFFLIADKKSIEKKEPSKETVSLSQNKYIYNTILCIWISMVLGENLITLFWRV